MELKPGYKQTEVGVIPEEWELTPFVSLGSVIDGDRGSNYPGSKDFNIDGHCLFLNAGNVTKGGFRFGDCAFISREKDERLSKGKLKRDDIVLTTRGTVGNFAHFDSSVSFEHIRINSGMVILRNESPDLDNAFLYVLLQSHFVGKQIERLTFGSAQPQLTVKGINEFWIVAPPLPEQHAIAEALSDVDGLLGGLDRLIAKKRDLKQAAMQQLLTGQTRLPGFHGEWRKTTLGQIISRFSTGLNPRKNFRLNSGGNFFYVTIKNFAVGQLFLDENCDLIDEAAFWRINERSDLRKEDVLFSSIGRVGDAYLITETPRNWNINESVFTLRPDKSQVVPLMLFYLLTDKTVTDALSQGVTGSTFKSIKQAQLKEIPCQLPASLEEQAAIAEVLTEMDGELAVLEQRREKTRALKHAMMQELLTGRTRLV